MFLLDIYDLDISQLYGGEMLLIVFVNSVIKIENQESVFVFDCQENLGLQFFFSFLKLRNKNKN